MLREDRRFFSEETEVAAKNVTFITFKQLQCQTMTKLCQFF